MSNKNYFEIISARIVFVAKYARVFRLLLIIAYLVYLAFLIIDVFFALDYIPSLEDVRSRFTPIKARTETISSIENYFLDRESGLTENLQKEMIINPFMPYKTENSILPTVSPNPENVVN